MSRTSDAPARGEKFHLPWDLTEWVDKETLLNWVVEEIATLDWANPELEAYLEANPAFQPRFLLTLTVYSYATGACESDEVVDLFFREESLKRLFPNETPQTHDIPRFRRQNRGLIKWGLVQVLKRALRKQLDLGESLIPAGLRRYVIGSAVTRIDVARHLDRGMQGE
jgi:hypothetical protein